MTPFDLVASLANDELTLRTDSLLDYDESLRPSARERNERDAHLTQLHSSLRIGSGGPIPPGEPATHILPKGSDFPAPATLK